MAPAANSDRELRRELEETRARLAEARDALEAIRNGEVDGLVMAGPEGRRIFTLDGAQEPYRLLIEQMSEGAMTLSADETVLYANETFARLLQTPLERVIGANLRTFVVPADQPGLARLLESGRRGSSSGEMSVLAGDGAIVPLRFGVSPLRSDPDALVCVVATDLSAVRQKENELSALHRELEQRVERRTSELAVSRLAALNMMEESNDARHAAEATNARLTEEIQRREQLEQELRSAHEQLAQMLEHSPAVLYRLKIVGQAIVPIAAARSVERLLGFPVAETLRVEWWRDHLHPEDSARARAGQVETLERGLSRTEYRLRTSTGDYRWVDDNRRLLRDAAGQPAEMVGVWLDITERKQSEAALARANREMIALSRQAGMAEVATSVLHNVGNVLNSVSVSAEIVVGRIRQPRSRGLVHVAELLREHAHDLPAFLGQDPRGQELPGYLLEVAASLARPPADLLEELEHLRKNIEHIKEIVAMQQSLARRLHVTESLALEELVRDALRINASALAGLGVEVEEEFHPLPPVVTDRHAVLQILVNLVANARHALAHVAGARRLILALAPHGGDRVRIEVRDTGIGIPAENLPRIFQHGFTTKKEGHGFGLHSGAIAAKQLGGALTAHSDGPGLGATFVLELPLRQPPTPP